MSLYRCSEDNGRDSYGYMQKDFGRKEFDQWFDKGHEEDHKGYEKDHCEKDRCDSESARALKKILSLVDELNNQDLRTLDEIIHRLLCERSSKKDF